MPIDGPGGLLFFAPLVADLGPGRPGGIGRRALCCCEGICCHLWLLYRGRRSSGWHNFARIPHLRHRQAQLGKGFRSQMGSRVFSPWGRRAGAVQDRTPISSCMRSTTTGMDMGAGPPAGSGGGLGHPAQWRRINRGPRHPRASHFAVNRLASPPRRPRLGGPVRLQHRRGGLPLLFLPPLPPRARPSYARSWFSHNI